MRRSARKVRRVKDCRSPNPDGRTMQLVLRRVRRRDSVRYLIGCRMALGATQATQDIEMAVEYDRTNLTFFEAERQHISLAYVY